jgi:hypothetical protein
VPPPPKVPAPGDCGLGLPNPPDVTGLHLDDPSQALIEGTGWGGRALSCCAITGVATMPANVIASTAKPNFFMVVASLCLSIMMIDRQAQRCQVLVVQKIAARLNFIHVAAI